MVATNIQKSSRLFDPVLTLLTHILTHLLAQRADLRAELLPFAGRTVLLELAPIALRFSITHDGQIQASDGPPDATLNLPLSLLPRLYLRDAAAERDIVISGDMQLAACVGRVLQALDWDAEADLARFIGDIAAHQVSSLTASHIDRPRKLLANLALTGSEYLRDEAQLLATPAALQQFYGDVDRLRDDLARLDKRLARLERAYHE